MPHPQRALSGERRDLSQRRARRRACSRSTWCSTSGDNCRCRADRRARRGVGRRSTWRNGGALRSTGLLKSCALALQASWVSPWALGARRLRSDISAGMGNSRVSRRSKPGTRGCARWWHRACLRRAERRRGWCGIAQWCLGKRGRALDIAEIQLAKWRGGRFCARSSGAGRLKHGGSPSAAASSTVVGGRAVLAQSAPPNALVLAAPLAVFAEKRVVALSGGGKSIHVKMPSDLGPQTSNLGDQVR